jgi:hypothetical protein
MGTLGHCVGEHRPSVFARQGGLWRPFEQPYRRIRPARPQADGASHGLRRRDSAPAPWWPPFAAGGSPGRL